MARICVISPSFVKMNCGLADYVANLTKFLDCSSLEISVITSDNQKIKEHINLTKETRLKIYPLVRRWDCGALFLIHKLVQEIQPDLVHIMYHWHVYNQGILKGIMVAFLPFLLKRKRPKSPAVIISFVHDLMGPYLFPKAGQLRKLGLLSMVLFADKLTVHSRRQQLDLGRLFPFLKKKVHCVPCGSGIFYERPLTERHGSLMTQKSFIVSFFGYIYPSKGLEYLIEALKILIGKGRNLKLLIIGGFAIDYQVKGFDAYPERIRALIAHRRLESFVEWTGFCKPEDVSVKLRSSDICVLPFNDGVNENGSSFNTVLSHGLPLITTRGPCMPDKLRDHENVLLVPARNSELLAQAIEELICNSNLRGKLAGAAKELYDKEYSWSVIADRTMRLYQEAIVGRAM